jgi:hypothetical protein
MCRRRACTVAPLAGASPRITPFLHTTCSPPCNPCNVYKYIITFRPNPPLSNGPYEAVDGLPGQGQAAAPTDSQIPAPMQSLRNGISQSDSTKTLLRLAASVEQLSTHILARAVVEAAQDRTLALSSASNFEETFGKGVRGHRCDCYLECFTRGPNHLLARLVIHF